MHVVKKSMGRPGKHPPKPFYVFGRCGSLLGQEELVELLDRVLGIKHGVANRPVVGEDLIVIPALKGLLVSVAFMSVTAEGHALSPKK